MTPEPRPRDRRVPPLPGPRSGGGTVIRFAEWLIGRACRGLPDEIRDDRYREWTAELPHILHDPQVRFAARRGLLTLLFAADQARTARPLGQARAPRRARAATPRRAAGGDLDQLPPPVNRLVRVLSLGMAFSVVLCAALGVSQWVIGGIAVAGVAGVVIADNGGLSVALGHAARMRALAHWPRPPHRPRRHR